MNPACQDDCGHCSLNEEVVLNRVCAGKYILEISGFSDLDYGEYALAVRCGANATYDAEQTPFTDENGGIYYALCGLIVAALCCFTVSVAVVNRRKRAMVILRERGEFDERVWFNHNNNVPSEEVEAVNQSLCEGGEQMLDSEVERNIERYNVSVHNIETDDDGAPPVAFGAEARARAKRKQDRATPASFELLHHEFNPSVIFKNAKPNDKIAEGDEAHKS